MANYVKFKQGLKKDFNTTNQPLTNGMIYFVIDENNHGSIYYDTVVDGAQATKKGTVHRVKFSGLPIEITGSVTGTGVISEDGESIVINTLTNHSHGLAHQDFTVNLSNDDTNLKWTRLGNQNGEGFWLKSIRGNDKAPAWFQPDYSAGIAFGGSDTKGIMSVRYQYPSVRFAGGNGNAPVWYFTITGANDKTYDLSKIGGHSSESAKLDHNVTFKITSTADSKNGGNGTVTDLSGPAVDLYLPTRISGFDLLQAARFQGTADNADTVDYFHMAEEKYKYETTQNRPTAGADWCIKISTPVWNSTSETIYLTAEGDNTHGTVILKTGSRQNNWWGYATNYNGTGIIGVYKLVSDSDDVYIKINGAYTSVRIRTTFKPTISIPTTIPDYNFTSVPWQGGFFSNAIYTDTLTFTTPKYWANIPISDNSNTETQPTFNTAYVSNWWRSTGNTGWWNETHLGGITMEDDTYVKVAGNKSFLIPNGSLKIGGNGNIFFATGNDDATLKIYGQTNTKYGPETIAIQTCFDNQDPQTSEYTTQYADRCNLLLQPKGGQVYIGKNLTTVGDTTYKLIVDGSQWTSGSQWVNGNLLFTDITGNTVDTGMSLKGVYGRIGGNDGWRIAGGARESNAGYLEISTCDDMNEPIYARQYGGGGDWNGYVTLARTFTLLDAAGRSRAPELFEAKKVHVNSLLDQNVAIADIGYQFQVTGTSNFTDNVDISGVTTHHNNIQIDTNYSIARPGKSSAWYGSHNNAMIRMTSVNSWSPLLAQKVTNGYWVLGHYDYNNEKNKNDDFRNQWVFGYLADSNLEGTTGASNSLTTTYRLLNIGGNDNQRMFVSAKYNAEIGSGTQPVYVQSNGNVTACSYSLNATIEAGTANRMAYYKAVNQIGSSEHYVTSNQVGINSNTTHDFTFYVGGNSYFSNLVTVYAGNNLGVKIGNTNITAIDGSLILQNNTALRFGSSEWDWNKWAGLKYVPDSKTIVIGLADSTNFVANSVQSGGTFLITGMTSVDFNKTASIKNLAIGGGIYWNPYVESADDPSDAASITVIAGGVADGTELRIQQQNDANDVINLVVNKSIYLNSKMAFNISDGWLRINETSAFAAGIYTGTSLVRSDNQLQVGDSGNKFYANSSGNGYFSNTLGIAGTNTDYKLYVNGKSWLRDALYIGSDVNGKDKNYIAFYGTTGDNAGGFNHTYIGENIFGSSEESSELVLFKGNDPGSNDSVESVVGAGPDRIRHIAAGHLFQVYRSALSGSFSAICASTTPSTVLEVNGGGLSIHGQKTVFTTTNSAGSSISSIGSVVRIYGSTYGNDANYLISKTAGVFSYGDGGPQIRFGTNYAGDQQEGALIYTDHDSAGEGVSWHFVSNQSDWSVNSKRYVARNSVTIGQLLPNSTYALYVGGGESYYTNHINMQQNASILFPQINQFLRWTPSTSDNNSTGCTWYGIGSYQAGDGYNWLNISNYWGINITTRDNVYLQHNGRVLTNSGNATGTVGSTTKPVYSNQGVLTPITSYEGNAATATLATQAGWLNKNTSLTYGANGLQYFDNYTSVTSGPKANANPGNDWYHIIRMNHANQGGYFVDLAICFHSDTFSYRRIVNGTDKGWVRLIDSSNISSQSVNYAASAGKLTTNAGSATKPIYFSNGVPVQCNDTLANNISGNAATATSANNSDKVDNYHAASFFIHDRLAATSTVGNDGLWGLTGSRSFHNALPDGLSNIYSYGQLISFSTDNSARLQIYAAHTGSSDSILSYRTGWGTDKKTWRTFIDSGNIGKQSVNYASSAGNADTVDGYHASDLAKKTDVSNSYVKKAGDTMTGELKNSSSDFTLSSDASEQRFKFLNASKNKHTVYFYKGAGTSSTIVGLWDSTDGHIWTYNTSGYFNLDKRVVIGGYNNSNYSLSTSSFICDSWIRTTGSTGWYNETYGGGWYMSDNTYIRNYNSKHLYITGRLGVNCELRLWEAGRQITRAGNSVAWINGRDGALIRQDSHSGYNPIFSCKTTNGSWELGPYDNNILYFAYGTDSNYKAGNNAVEHPLRLMPGKGVLLSGLNYGTSLPSSGTNGQVFFKI